MQPSHRVPSCSTSPVASPNRGSTVRTWACSRPSRSMAIAHTSGLGAWHPGVGKLPHQSTHQRCTRHQPFTDRIALADQRDPDASVGCGRDVVRIARQVLDQRHRLTDPPGSGQRVLRHPAPGRLGDHQCRLVGRQRHPPRWRTAVRWPTSHGAVGVPAEQRSARPRLQHRALVVLVVEARRRLGEIDCAVR